MPKIAGAASRRSDDCKPLHVTRLSVPLLTMGRRRATRARRNPLKPSFVTRRRSSRTASMGLRIRRYSPELVAYMSAHGRSKVMFGTNYPMIPHVQCLNGPAELGLDNETRDSFRWRKCGPRCRTGYLRMRPWDREDRKSMSLSTDRAAQQKAQTVRCEASEGCHKIGAIPDYS
jgi:hypothetical protein